MAPRKSSTRPRIEARSSLLIALDFVTIAAKDIGPPHTTHLRVANKTAVAADGVLSAGAVIEEDLYACPHAHFFRAAIARVGLKFQIVQLSPALLVVSSETDDYEAHIPCIPPEQTIAAFPDANVGPLDGRVRSALEACSKIVTENAPRVELASIYMRAGTCVSTNGEIMLEYWHGCNVPAIVLPKVFGVVLGKVKKTICGFGYSAETFTVWFDDNTWLKTQTYSGVKWPIEKADKILNASATLGPIQSSFFTAFDSIEKFSENGCVFFNENELRSHPSSNNPTREAGCDVLGLPSGPVFRARNLSLARPYCERVDWRGPDNSAYFANEVARGVIIGAAAPSKSVVVETLSPITKRGDIDDEIPF